MRVGRVCIPLLTGLIFSGPEYYHRLAKRDWVGLEAIIIIGDIQIEKAFLNNVEFKLVNTSFS